MIVCVISHWGQSVPFGLRAAAERGLSAVFYSLCRRNSPSHLGVLDEQGYSLLHHAAKHNHTHIICQLATTGVNLNQTSSGRFSRTGQRHASFSLTLIYTLSSKLFTNTFILQ